MTDSTKKIKENHCACICDSVRSFVSFTSTEIHGAPLCKQMNTFRPMTNEQTNNLCHDSWSMDVPVQSTHLPHVNIQSVSGE